jgi:hypothetical protein
VRGDVHASGCPSTDGHEGLCENSFWLSFRGVPIWSGRRRISQCVENTQSRIPPSRFSRGRNDSPKGALTQTLKPCPSYFVVRNPG